MNSKESPQGEQMEYNSTMNILESENRILKETISQLKNELEDRKSVV